MLPYLVFVKLGLDELHPTLVVLQLADRSTKIPRGIVEDVLIQVDKFYFPVDFIVIDTQPIQDSRKHIPIILSWHFWQLPMSHSMQDWKYAVVIWLRELHPTPVVLQLADQSTKISIVEDVLIQVDKFYFLVDFIVIDTQPIQDARKHIPIILSWHFLATADTHI